MRTIFFFSISLLTFILAFSCTDNEISNNENEQLLKRVTVSGDDIMYEDNAMHTRTSYTMETSLKFSWSNGDVLGIYPVGGTQVDFPISSGDGSKSANFDGGAWALRANYTYAAYYPFSDANFHVNQTQIPVSYEGQTQNGNNSLAHIGKYDFMAAAATQPSSNGNVSLAMKHLGSFIRLQLTMPVADSFSKVTLSTDGETQFMHTATYDLTAETPSLSPVSTSASYSIDLVNVQTTEPNELVTVYGFIGPLNLLGKKITITVNGQKNITYIAEVDGKNMIARQGYNYATEFKKGTNASGDDISFVDDIPYITFKANESQTIRMTEAVATLEYSVNDEDWLPLGTNTINFGGAYGDIKLRGKSSTGTNAYVNDYRENIFGDFYLAEYIQSQIIFGNMTPVMCSGDIRTLVDYDLYQTITQTGNINFSNLFKNCKCLISSPDLPFELLSTNCYSNMFYGCTGLTTAPELPATTLTASCYSNMFYGCTGLTTAPELPATTLAKSCYSSMFSGCTGLTTAPELPATTLAESCYSGMLDGCTGLTSAPELPATTLAGACYSYMFSGCTGLTTAPELPATTLAASCYSNMFYGCTGLTTAPELPATTLAKSCYSSMFGLCTKITSVLELPATTLAESCYDRMFSGCTGLTSAPELPATTLAGSCYSYMFYGCTGLTSAPDLVAKDLASCCYQYMFANCSNLNYVKILANNGEYNYNQNYDFPFKDWLKNVSPNGVLLQSTCYIDDYYRCPSAWDVIYLDSDGNVDNTPYYCLSTTVTNYYIQLEKQVDGLEYSMGGGEWKAFNNSAILVLSKRGVRFRGCNNYGTVPDGETSNSFKVSTSNPFKVEGDLRTLVNYKQYETVDINKYNFNGLLDHILIRN